LKSCRVTPDLDAGTFCFVPKFYQTKSGDKLIIRISSFGQLVGSAECAANEGMPVIVNLSEIHPWSPEDPFLYDIEYFVVDSSGCRIDTVYGYAGLRKVHVEGGKYYLNNKPVFLRFVLDQGFYPDGIWTAPSDEALKRDIQLSMAAGFNGARLHQKVFEERFHYWADKLGYLTWGESSSWGLQFCGGIYDNHLGWKSAYNFLTEWKQIIERDYNHPSIITWTPLNETWPGSDMRLYNYVISEIYDTTKYLDPIRPCNDCSGYSHAKTDLWTVHFYAKDAEHLSTMLNPKDKPVFMKDHENCYHGQPYIVDEFGGLMFIAPDRQKFADNTWGYYGIQLKNEDELCAKIDEQVDVMI